MDIDPVPYWTFFLILLGSPVCGFLIGVALVGRPFLKSRSLFLAGYYGAVMVSYVFMARPEEDILQPVFCCFVWSGPVVSLWFVFTASKTRSAQPLKLGLCVKCGYDLRASKDRCPECGEEFHKRNYSGKS